MSLSPHNKQFQLAGLAIMALLPGLAWAVITPQPDSEITWGAMGVNLFGGLALFGFVGIMVGPLLLTLFIASLRIYEQEKANII